MCKQIWQQGPAEKTWTYFLPIANCPKFIEKSVPRSSQKQAHTATSKIKNLGISKIIWGGEISLRCRSEIRLLKLKIVRKCILGNSISTAGCDTILSAYTMYRHLEEYCTQPSICAETVDHSILLILW